MAFTRFNDDPCRIEKYLQETTGTGRYMLNVPGNGTNMPFNNDPHIRLQKWGANHNSNRIDIENELFSSKRGMNRDLISDQYNSTFIEELDTNRYKVIHTQTDETRATNPAWTLRDIDHTYDRFLQFDPQENVHIPFDNNINTRIIESNNYQRQRPNILF